MRYSAVRLPLSFLNSHRPLSGAKAGCLTGPLRAWAGPWDAVFLFLAGAPEVGWLVYMAGSAQCLEGCTAEAAGLVTRVEESEVSVIKKPS